MLKLFFIKFNIKVISLGGIFRRNFFFLHQFLVFFSHSFKFFHVLVFLSLVHLILLLIDHDLDLLRRLLLDLLGRLFGVLNIFGISKDLIQFLGLFGHRLVSKHNELLELVVIEGVAMGVLDF